MAAFADMPCGPFFVTSDTVVPVREDKVSASLVRTSLAFGFPLSKTARRSPLRDGGEGLSVTEGRPRAPSGR
jgi:hypothetical protein